MHVSSSSARASLSPSPSIGSSGSPARTSSPMPVRAAHTSAIRSARRRRATNAEDLRGRLVEPLRVVDDADERLLLGDLGEQRQRGEPDQERSGAGRRSDRRPSPARRAAGRAGGRGDPASARRAGGGRCRPAPSPTRRRRPSRRASRRHARIVVQQRALARAGFAAKDDDSAPTGARVGQDPVKYLALSTTPRSLIGRPPSGRAYTCFDPQASSHAWKTRGATGVTLVRGNGRAREGRS